MEEKLLADATSDDQPSPKWETAKAIVALLAVAALFVTFVVAVVSIIVICYTEYTDPYRPPTISIVVDGCSGLAARVPRAFNFTVTIDNPGGSEASDVCVGGDAVVLYGGVPLATGVVQDLCVPPDGAGEVAIRAASGGVGLPSELAELMTEEMKRAGGVVRLEVRVVSGKQQGSLMCRASLGIGAPQPSPCESVFLMDESDGVERSINP